MKKNKRDKFFLGILFFLFILGFSAGGAEALTEGSVNILQGIRVYLDGKRLAGANGEPADAIACNGVTYVPVRAVGSALGCGIQWDNSKKELRLSSPYALTGEKTVAAWGTYCSSYIFKWAENVTLRETVCLNMTGNRVSVRFSNKWGPGDIFVGSVSIAKAVNPETSEIDPATSVTLTFDGKTAAVLSAGMSLVSDPVQFEARAGEACAISLYFPKGVTFSSGNFYGGRSRLSSQPGDFTAAASFPGERLEYPDINWDGMPFLETVNVVTEREYARTVVILGDSTSTNHWPGLFQKRLWECGVEDVSVISRSCGGNRLMFDDGLSGEGVVNRYEHDVFETNGIHAVILKTGLNDLLSPVPGGTETAPLEEMIRAEENLIQKSHEAGIKVYLCTITPFGASGETEEKRLAWNAWIKSNSAADGYIDLSRAMEDPLDSARLSQRYTEDNLHPNALGEELIANLIPLEWVM